MPHILPIDELKRQLDAGEIDQAYYERMRGTQADPPPPVCATPRCTRPAFIVQRGRPLCALCGLVERNRRR